MKIFKYRLALQSGIQIRDLPSEGRLLHVDMQEEALMLWAMVDPQSELKPHKFRVVATGEEVDKNLLHHHIGTVMDGAFVWHVFGGF